MINIFFILQIFILLLLFTLPVGRITIMAAAVRYFNRANLLIKRLLKKSNGKKKQFAFILYYKHASLRTEKPCFRNRWFRKWKRDQVRHFDSNKTVWCKCYTTLIVGGVCPVLNTFGVGIVSSRSSWCIGGFRQCTICTGRFFFLLGRYSHWLYCFYIGLDHAFSFFRYMSLQNAIISTLASKH